MCHRGRMRNSGIADVRGRDVIAEFLHVLHDNVEGHGDVALGAHAGHCKKTRENYLK